MDEQFYKREIKKAIDYIDKLRIDKAKDTLIQAFLMRETPEIIKKETKEANDLEKALDALDGLRDDKQVKKSYEELMKDLEDDTPIIRVVNVILEQSIKDNASEINIYPTRRRVTCDYGTDNQTYNMKVPKYVHAPLISRLKVMADLNIAERRKEQEGKINIKYEGKDYSFDVKTIPTEYGEKAIISRKI